MKDTYSGAFVGGHPALDFLNTVSGNSKNREKSRIGDWEHFQSWARASTMFHEECLEQFDVVSRSSSNASLLNEVHHLRETAYGLLSAIVSGETPPREHQAFIEAHIKMAIKNGVLNYKDNLNQWTIDADHPDWLIGTLALSIEHLVRSKEFQKLRECGRCSWLFLDAGRGKGRKWCDMRTCGNRSKSKSFKNRHKQ